jgi:hypothetical protein
MISSDDRTRLAKLLGLLGSDFAGERNAAGLAAHRFVRERGIAWSDLLAAPRSARRESTRAPWHATCAELAKRPGHLRPWERQFIAGLPQFPHLSAKQRRILDELASRVLREPAA